MARHPAQTSGVCRKGAARTAPPADCKTRRRVIMIVSSDVGALRAHFIFDVIPGRTEGANPNPHTILTRFWILLALARPE